MRPVVRRTALFLVCLYASQVHAQRIIINEIHYNPPGDGDAAEFVELYNADDHPLDLSGWNLGGFANPGCTFPAGTLLAPGAYLVAAKDPAGLLLATGYSTPHTWGSDDSLANDGETVRLMDAGGAIIDTVTYSDAAPWPTVADGDGPSLELIHPDLDNARYSAWAASAVEHGSPGAANSVFSAGPQIIDEIPRRQTAVDALDTLVVVFSAPVTGVMAGDLWVGESPATEVTPQTGPANTYTFTGFAAPAPGSVEIVLNPGAIMDDAGTPFAGAAWTLSVGIRVVINEIHYHPPDPHGLAEFVELYNAGAHPADLAGWAFTDGIEAWLAPGTILAPGEYLVLAYDPQLLASVTGYAEARIWLDGRLDNAGERLELSDAFGNVMDLVRYADGGSWPGAADGDGPSLELVHPRLPNEYAAAWRAASAPHGSPGVANSVFLPQPPPIIVDTLHAPAIPLGGESVRITATVFDDQPNPSVTLYYRQDAAPTLPYTAAAMFDDGLHGDGLAGDGIYGATVPGLPAGERLDFTLRAADGTSVSAAPLGHDTLVEGEYPAQTFLCKFSDEPLATDLPQYHLITTQRTRDLQATRDETEYDATFIRCRPDGECEIYYNITERYRGAHSLLLDPPSFRFSFPSDRPLPSELGFPIREMNLMAVQPVRWALGLQLFAAQGHPTPVAQFIRLNTNPLSHTRSGVTTHQNIVYANVERIDDDFIASQDGAVSPTRFPDRCSISGTPCGVDGDCPPGETCVSAEDGNMYRGRHDGSRLEWEGFDPNAYKVDAAGANGYQLITNEDVHDWTDLITLCDALTCSPSDGGVLCTDTDYDGWYPAHLPRYVDVDQWAAWFGLHMLLNNAEGGIYRDTGDDYFLYFPPTRDRATLIAWDLDSIFASREQTYSTTIWRTTVPAVQRFIRHNAFAGRFVGSIADLLAGPFSETELNTRIDAIPDAAFVTLAAPPGGGPRTRQGFKDWGELRREYLLTGGGIIWDTTLTGVPESPYTDPNPLIAVGGALGQAWTHSVLLNGEPVDQYSVYEATWSSTLALRPGSNPLVLQVFDHLGNELERLEDTVLYRPGPAGLEIVSPPAMVANGTFTLKATLTDPQGLPHWRTWNLLGGVSARRASDGADVPLTITVFETVAAGAGGGVPPEDSIRFYNGVGCVSFALDDPNAAAGEQLDITVSAAGLDATTTVVVLPDDPAIFTPLAGVLSGPDLVWDPNDGVIHLVGSVTVPEGETLRIEPGTLVMVEPGPLGDGTLVTAHNATIDARGTRAAPIFFFPAGGTAALSLPQTVANNPAAWRGVEHSGIGASFYDHVFITGAGNGPLDGHARACVLRFANSHSFVMTDCVFADCPGKALHGAGAGEYTVQRTLGARLGFGGEFLGSGYALTIEDCWFTRIGYASKDHDLDGDILHIDRSTSTAVVRRCILTDGGDDVIDHSTGAHPAIEDCILYDARDKAVSIGAGTGTITLDNCLVFSTPGGINCLGAPAFISRTTIGPGSKLNSPSCSASVIERTIHWPGALNTCCGTVTYTLIGDPNGLGCGAGTFTDDPRFVDAVNRDYDLQPDSPALTAGPAGARIGWLGFPDAEPTCVFDEECDDGDPCTVDLCDAGTCVHVPVDCSYLDDACNIGVCNPLNGQCELQPRPFGTPCDDGLYCTVNDACVSGVCVGDPRDCSDGLPCTTDACDESLDACISTLADGYCLIDDACFAAGERNPAAPCEWCDPVVSTTAWTPVPDGAPCDDGLYCNGAETCQGGVCAPGAPPCSHACESCDEDADRCAWCAFDLDRDAFIGPGDFAIFAGCWAETATLDAPCAVANFDGSPDGFIGPGDFAAFAGCWGTPCGACTTCAGSARMARRVTRADGVALHVVPRRSPSASDVAPELPPADLRAAPRETLYLELWARLADPSAGLAAVYANLTVDGPVVAVRGHAPSAKFPLFADAPRVEPVADRKAAVLLRNVGGCVSPQSADVGRDRLWVRVSTLTLDVDKPGVVQVALESATAGFGVSLHGEPGTLAPREVRYGACRVEIMPRPAAPRARVIERHADVER